jgi:cytochrome c biogenesis protein CcdA
MFLALAFCPATASLYFGILIPLSLKFDQVYLFPLLYGFGGLLPIVIMGFMVQSGGEKFLQGKWAKSITLISGYLLIIIGIYIAVQQLYLQ